MFVSHQSNYDIIYIFQVVENFLHLFVCTYALMERPFSLKLTWASEVQYAILCLSIQVIMQIELVSDILREPIWGRCFYMMSSLVYSFS
jgi:hypothetical protein